MIRAHSVPTVFLCAAAVAQSPAEALVHKLSDDATWRRTAADLVLLRRAAVVPLATALKAAAEDEKHTHAHRILTVLKRLGMDAADATGVVWGAMEFLNAPNRILALKTAAQIHRVGGKDPREHLAAISNLIRGPRSDQVQRQTIPYLSMCRRRVRLKHRFDPEQSVEKLIGALKEPLTESSYFAVQMLGQRSKAARAALPRLAELLHAVHKSKVRFHFLQDAYEYGQELADTIVRIDPKSKEAALAYGYRINSEPFRYLKLHATRELMMLGPHMRSAVGYVLEFLRSESEDTELVCLVINGITMLGWKAEWALPTLEKLTGSEDPKIASRAKSALKRIRRKL